MYPVLRGNTPAPPQSDGQWIVAKLQQFALFILLTALCFHWVVSLDHNKSIERLRVQQALAGFEIPQNYTDYSQQFMLEKQWAISEMLIEQGAPAVERLSLAHKRELAFRISQLYMLYMTDLPSESSAFQFLESATLAAVEQQLVSQVPASILLAQAIYSSGLGTFAVGHNYFLEQDADTGDLLQFASLHDSFRHQALNWTQQAEYAKLFTGGKDFQKWLGMMGAAACFNSPDCELALENLIGNYSFMLLDF